MVMNQLASKIAKMEGKKVQVRIGDVREILAIISDLIWASDKRIDLFKMFVINGKSRAKRNSRKKK